MAENADEQKEMAKKAGGGGSKTVIIIVIAGFLMFTMLAGAGFFILWKRLPAPENSKTEAAENEAREKPVELTMGPVFTLEPFVVNLADPNGSRFLRSKMTLEFEKEGLLEKMDKFSFPIRDKILTILSSKEYREVNSIQGKKQLRAEITTAVDGLLGKGSVKNVYFSDFVAE